MHTSRFLAALLALASAAHAAPPVAGADVRVIRTASRPEALTGLLSNDTDADNNVLHITAISVPPLHGTATLSKDVITYDPGSTFKGDDALTYVVSDGTSIATGRVTILNPFLKNRGTFSALFPGSGANNGNAGYFETRVTPEGNFSCVIRLAGETFRFAATFGLDGNFTGDLGPHTLTLHFPVEVGARREITGTFTPLGISFVAPLVPYGTAFPSPRQGAFTVIFPIAVAADGLPKGISYSKLTIQRSGRATMTGVLGDSTHFSSSTYLQPDGKLPVYATLRPEPGNIFGTISFTSPVPPAIHTKLTGTMNWFRAKDRNQRMFPKGFQTVTNVTGSSYIAPTSEQSIINVPATPPNCTVTFNGGGIRTTKVLDAILGRRPIVGDYLLNFTDLRAEPALKMDYRRGTFLGSFLLRTTDKTYRFGGVFIQSDNVGAGVFPGFNTTGSVLLAPKITTP